MLKCHNSHLLEHALRCLLYKEDIANIGWCKNSKKYTVISLLMSYIMNFWSFLLLPKMLVMLATSPCAFTITCYWDYSNQMILEKTFAKGTFAECTLSEYFFRMHFAEYTLTEYTITKYTVTEYTSAECPLTEYTVFQFYNFRLFAQVLCNLSSMFVLHSNTRQ